MPIPELGFGAADTFARYNRWREGAVLQLRWILRTAVPVITVLAGLTMLPAAASAASTATAGRMTYDCSGGTIPAGFYHSIYVTGVCYMPEGNVVVQGNVTVAPWALLDAVSKVDHPPAAPVTPIAPATVTIGGNVFVGQGAALLFGCSPNITCGPPPPTVPPAITYDRIGGNLSAFGAQAVVVHSASIQGSVSLAGGGGGTAAKTCSAQTPTAPSPLPTLEPWSEDPYLDYIPVYTDFEDSTIGGNITVNGLTSCWLGSFRDQIGGNATYTGNAMGDPDAVEIASNVVTGNMVCFANTAAGVPTVQFGDSAGSSNVVGGWATGQCGFNVTPLNPAPEATTTKPVGIPEHITVSKRSLRTFFGTYTSTTVTTRNIGTTAAGDQIVAELGDFNLTGSGLTGSGTFTPTPTVPLGHSGQALLATVYPSGTEAFTVYDTCECAFAGHTGLVLLRAYGTTSRHGFTSGTFLVTSGGEQIPGNLETLVGYGSFFGPATGPLRVVEHLATT